MSSREYSPGREINPIIEQVQPVDILISFPKNQTLHSYKNYIFTKVVEALTHLKLRLNSTLLVGEQLIDLSKYRWSIVTHT
jgi:hypothetical protein